MLLVLMNSDILACSIEYLSRTSRLTAVKLSVEKSFLGGIASMIRLKITQA